MPIQTEVVVLGSGPGGYSAAFRAADLGKKVVLIERNASLGGVCLNVGCIPSKTLLHAARVLDEAEEIAEYGIEFAKPKIDIKKLLEKKDSVIKKLTGGLAMMAKQRKVEVVTGNAKFKSKNEIVVDDQATVKFQHCIIAAGSEPVNLPFIPKDERIV